MNKKDLDSIINEYMDLSDKATLNKMTNLYSLDEAGQNQFLISLTSRLYDKIKEKATKIDYSTVEASRGDITKIQNYDQIVECIGILRSIVIEYHESPIPVDIISDAVNNLKTRKKLFTKAFVLGSSLPILTYDNIAMAVVESTAFMITTCIEYIKNPGAETFDMAINKTAYAKTRQNLLWKTLGDFNKSCDTKQLDDALNLTMNKAIANREAAELGQKVEVKGDHPYLSDDQIKDGTFSALHDDDDSLDEGFGSAIAGVAGYVMEKTLLFLAKLFIPFIRQITYYYFYHRQKMSDYYSDLADFCELNAQKVLQNQDIPEEERKEIYNKQMALAQKYRKRANEMSIDYSTSKNKADKQQAEETKKYNGDETDNEDEGDDGSYGSIFEAEITEGYGPMFYESPFGKPDAAFLH